MLSLLDRYFEIHAIRLDALQPNLMRLCPAGARAISLGVLALSCAVGLGQAVARAAEQPPTPAQLQTETILQTETSLQTETVLERLARTGVLTAGTNATARPFAFRNQQGELTGYSVEMLQLIKTYLEIELDRELDLKLVPLQSDERIPALLSRQVDLVCDASSFTWERDRQVDFSVSYGITGTRLLVRRDAPIENPNSLTGVRIAALPKTTNAIAMERQNANVVLFDDRQAAYDALAQGEVAAVAADGILLEAWLSQSPRAEQFAIVSIPYSQEGIACMVPENNSDFLDAVNYRLIRYMQDFLDEEKTAVAIFDRWFGPQSAVPLSRDLRALTIDNMQLVIDFREAVPPLPLPSESRR